MKKHVVLAGASEATDTELLTTLLTARKKLDIIVCLCYEDTANMIINAPLDIAIIGKYAQGKDQVGEADEAALQICRQNSRKLIKLCQQRDDVSYVLVDTEENPTWLEDLKKLLA